MLPWNFVNINHTCHLPDLRNEAQVKNMHKLPRRGEDGIRSTCWSSFLDGTAPLHLKHMPKYFLTNRDMGRIKEHICGTDFITKEITVANSIHLGFSQGKKSPKPLLLPI